MLAAALAAALAPRAKRTAVRPAVASCNENKWMTRWLPTPNATTSNRKRRILLLPPLRTVAVSAPAARDRMPFVNMFGGYFGLLLDR